MALSERDQQIIAWYRAEDLTGARRLANAAVGEEPGNETCCAILAMIAARCGDAAEFLAVIQHVHLVTGNASRFAMTVLQDLLNREQYGALTGLEAKIAKDHMAFILVAYFAGCARMMQGDLDGAFARFRWFQDNVAAFMAFHRFDGDEVLNIVFRQARLVGDAAEVERRLALPPAPLPAIEMVCESRPEEDAIVVAACDRRYFDLFADSFLAALWPLRAGGGIHLHLIAPEAGQARRLEALTQRYHPVLGASIEPRPLVDSLTYYACSRYFIIEPLLDLYRRPILTFDLDMTLSVDLDMLRAGGADMDFACFSTLRNEPCSVYAAGIMYWPDRPETRDLVRQFRQFCWPDLQRPSRANWLLDQGALFSLLHYRREIRGTLPPLRFGDLRQRLGRGLHDTIGTLGDNADKSRVKSLKQMTELGLGG